MGSAFKLENLAILEPECCCCCCREEMVGGKFFSLEELMRDDNPFVFVLFGNKE